MKKERFITDVKHLNECHARWLKQRSDEASAYGSRQRIDGQCGACRFYVPLTGIFIEDWGACTNGESQFDGKVMFEHDGCSSFVEASDAWQSPYPMAFRQYWLQFCKRQAVLLENLIDALQKNETETAIGLAKRLTKRLRKEIESPASD